MPYSFPVIFFPPFDTRRDKTLNYFNIMLKKRVKNEDKDTELDEEEKAAKTKASKSKKKNKDFVSMQIFCRVLSRGAFAGSYHMD